MLSSLYIPTSPITSQTDALQAAGTMRREKLTDLPVVDPTGRYAGMLSLANAETAHPGTPCSQLALPSPAIPAADAPTAALQILAETGMQTAPVVDADGILVGCVGRDESLRMAAHITGADAHGSSLSVWMTPADYQMSTVISVVEQTGAQVISATTRRRPHEVQLLLTTTASDPTPLTDALQRHGIQCAAYLANSHGQDDIIRKNYDALMAYLNI